MRPSGVAIMAIRFALSTIVTVVDYGVTGAHLRSTVPEANVWVSTGLSLTLF